MLPLSPVELLRSGRALLESHFGPSRNKIRITIADGSGHLLVIALPLRQLADPEPATPMEQDILEAIGDSVMRGQELAKRSGYRWGSRFRMTLSKMCKSGLLVRRDTGYQIARQSQGSNDAPGS